MKCVNGMEEESVWPAQPEKVNDQKQQTLSVFSLPAFWVLILAAFPPLRPSDLHKTASVDNGHPATGQPLSVVPKYIISYLE